MAGLWGLRRHRRPPGYCNLTDSHVVHVYFLSHPRFSAHHLHDHCFLDEYEAVYPRSAPEPDKIPLSQNSKVKSQNLSRRRRDRLIAGFFEPLRH